MDEKIRILNYAQEKFFKEGFYKVSMDELASDLRVSKKTIYKYFPSKEDLVKEIAFGFRDFMAMKLTKIFEADENAVMKIINLLTLIGNIWFKVSEKMMLDIQIHYPAYWQEIDEFRTNMMYKNITGLIKQGKKEGIFADHPEDIVVTIFISSIRAIVNPNFLINHKYSFKDAIRFTFSILLKGVLTAEGEKIFEDRAAG